MNLYDWVLARHKPSIPAEAPIRPWSELTERDKALRFAKAFGIEPCYLTIGVVMHIAQEKCEEIRLIKMNSGGWGARVDVAGEKFETAISETSHDALAQALMKAI